ncbi:hypothetical protein S1E_3300 [Escherichia coli B94]|nr:hypothetical protein S1E_3300 [Escherichia coli B94]
MSEITSLVTAEAVKEVLRSEEVRSALKQKLRHNLEARLDAEVDAILDELLGAPAAPEPEGIAGEGSASDSGRPHTGQRHDDVSMRQGPSVCAGGRFLLL